MREKIGVELLRSSKVKPREKTFEIYDTELKGFTLKIYPDIVKDGKTIPGGKIYLVRYRLPSGKQVERQLAVTHPTPQHRRETRQRRSLMR